MGTDRIARVNEQLRREISANLFRVIHESDADMATITVTKVTTSRDLRQAHVSVSVRADEDEQARVMQLLSHHRNELQSLINKDMLLKYTPHITFHLDDSIAKGHHVLDILSHLPPIADTDEEEAGTEQKQDPD